MNIKTISKIGVALAASLAFVGCKSFMNPSTGTTLLEEDNYKRAAQIKANFMGVAASFQQIKEHWIVLSELRGDLVEPTYNAPTEFWDVYNYNVISENSLVDPSVYYRAIINCNDFIRHAVAYDIKYPGVVAEALAKGMIADALRYRAWCYLTLGKLYGEAIYYDIALVDDVDILEDPDDWRSPMDSVYFDGRPPYDPDSDDPRPDGVAIRMPLDRLVEELIDHLHTGVKGYDGLATFNWNDITNTTDASWNRLSINPNALMGELYMWKAAFNPEQEFPLYQTALNYLMTIPNRSGAKNVFTLAKTTDQSKGGSWTSSQLTEIFTKSTDPITGEILTYIPFRNDELQTHNLGNYYNKDKDCYMRPTQVIMDMYDNTPKDAGYGDNVRKSAFTTISLGESYIKKYVTTNSDGPIIIYRAAEIHLMIAECLNHIGFVDEAMTIFGKGLSQFWKDGFYEFPYSNPLFSTNMSVSKGVRGRVDLAQYAVPDASGDMERTKRTIDSLIADEMAMECSFEGKRYFSLLRQCIFWDDTERFANTISAKYGDNASTIKAALMDRKNWFIDYKQTELY